MSVSTRRLRNFVEHLAAALTSLEVVVALDGLFEREASIDGDLEVTGADPFEDVVRSLHELFASDGVIVQLRAW